MNAPPTVANAVTIDVAIAVKTAMCYPS